VIPNGSPPPKTLPWPRETAVSVVAWGVLGLGIVVLAGWAEDVEVLKGVLGGATMKPNAALGFVLCGVALHCTGQEKLPIRVVGVVSTLTLLTLGLITVGEDLFEFSTPIDQLLFREDPRTASPGTGTPGRMSPVAALSFAVLAASLLARSRYPRSSQVLAGIVAGLGALAAVGHIYSEQELYRVGSSTEMAFHTGVGLLVAAFGCMIARGDVGISATLFDPTPAGEQLRRQLPAALLAPVGMGVLSVVGVRAELWTPGFAEAFAVIATTGLLLALAFWSYGALARSDRRRLEATSSLERYKRTFQHATIGIGHLALDGRWIRANERLCKMLGYDEAELLTKTYAEVGHLADLELDVKQWELLRRGEIGDYGVERRFITKDGEELVGDVRLVRDKEEAGRAHLIAIVQDITGRKLSEGTLRVYERALAATQNGIVITDESTDDHPIAYVNPAFLRITGYDAADVIGCNCRFLNAQARDQTSLDELRSAVKSGSECAVLLRNHRKDGQPFWNQLAIAPVRGPAGQLTNFVGVVVDATTQMHEAAEREALLQAAEAANQAKARFLSVISHELRSPMNAILAWTSILRDEGGERDVGRAVEAIDSAIRGQVRLVDDLLDASQLRAGALEVDPVQIDVAAVVRQAVDRAMPAAEERGVTLQLTSPSKLPAVLDPERLDQIIRNLLDNALKFTPEEERVNVTAALQDGACVIEVRDTGKGMSAEQLSHVFEEFWQAERTGSSGGKGLGLGLAIVKHLVERQGGTVRAESAGPDQGARFEVTFPVAGTPRARAESPPPVPAPAERIKEGPARPPADRTTGGPAQSPLLGVEVLVVEDDKATLEALSVALERIRAIPKPARSVTEALHYFEMGAPEILVSDIGLPDRDGLDLIRAVREMEKPKRSLLALAVTGLADPAERRRIQRAGFDAYLAKPIEPPVVLDRLSVLYRLYKDATPASRRVLLVHDERENSKPLAGRLEALGHVVHEVADAANVVAEAASFEPQVVLASLPMGEMPAASLRDRLTATSVRAVLVGILDPDDETAQQPFDYLLWRPVEDGALDRILRFGPEGV